MVSPRRMSYETANPAVRDLHAELSKGKPITIRTGKDGTEVTMTLTKGTFEIAETMFNACISKLAPDYKL